MIFFYLIFLCLFRRLRFQGEIGLINREVRKWWPRKPICERNSKEVTAIGITEVKWTIWILFLGNIFAIVVLLCEIMFKTFSTYTIRA